MSISSIFNDVLGPVMRGPSSSHSAAACRIGRLAHDLMGGRITNVVIDYDPNGSLVTTHESQGTDMGLYGGFLGWEADDARMLDYSKEIAKAGIRIQVNYLSYNAPHPNHYRLQISNEAITHTLSAISTGGGMIEVIEIDGCQVSIVGDSHELLIYGKELDLIRKLCPENGFDNLIVHEGFIEIKTNKPVDDELLTHLKTIPGVTEVDTCVPYFRY